MYMNIDENGDRIWKNKEGIRHRKDGPACEWNNGSKSWWINNERHRLDGPAIERKDGSKEWYINGIEYTEEQFKEKIKEIF